MSSLVSLSLSSWFFRALRRALFKNDAFLVPCSPFCTSYLLADAFLFEIRCPLHSHLVSPAAEWLISWLRPRLQAPCLCPNVSIAGQELQRERWKLITRVWFMWLFDLVRRKFIFSYCLSINVVFSGNYSTWIFTCSEPYHVINSFHCRFIWCRGRTDAFSPLSREEVYKTHYHLNRDSAQLQLGPHLKWIHANCWRKGSLSLPRHWVWIGLKRSTFPTFGLLAPSSRRVDP